MTDANKTKKPVIMLVITKADIGGAQLHVLQILNGLSDRYQFILVVGAVGFLTAQVMKLGVSVEIVESLVRPIEPLTDIVALIHLIRLIKKHRPAFVHAHSFKAGVVARLAAIATGTPRIFTAHGWSFTTGAPKLQRLTGLVVECVIGQFTNAIVTISEFDAALAARYYVGRKAMSFTVRNAASASELKPSPEIEPVTLLTIGRLTTVKNQKLLLQAMAQLPEQLRLIIVGGGVLHEELEKQISDYGLSSRVLLTGEDTDIDQHLLQSQIYVLTSLYEGLPLSILEAMAAGLPVISTDVGGVSEAVVDQETGLLVPSRDLSALVLAISELAADASKRTQMGANARERHRCLFGVERFLAETEEVYSSLLKQFCIAKT